MDVFEFDYYQRLENDYLEHRSLFIAFDFDNTVFDYHNLRINYDKIITLLKECKEVGFTLILFTANAGVDLMQVEEYLEFKDIPYDLTNENPLMDTKKPYYNLLLDDRAGLEEAYNHLRKLINKIKLKEI